MKLKSIIRHPIKAAATWLRTDTGYDAAKFVRAFRNWFPSMGSPDGEIIKDLSTLRSRSRDLYRNNGVARGAIRLMVSNVIGRGLKLQSVIDRPTIQKYFGWTDEQSADYFNNLENKIETRFRLWAESKESDARGQRTFYENQSLIYLSKLVSGEVFVTLPMRTHKNGMFKLRVGLIEADQVQSPGNSYATTNNRDGLITDDEGTPISVWINKNQETYPYRFEEIPFFGKESGRPLVLHIFKADRPGQSRGVPYLAPVMQILKDMDAYKKAELIRAKVVSLFSVFIKSQNANALNSNGIVTNDPQDATSETAEGRDYTLAPGAVMQLQPGEDVTFGNPGNVSSNYEPLSTALMIEVGMALGIPHEILRRYFGASYSASRGAVEEYKKEVRIERDEMESDVCAPVFREWLIEEALAGSINMLGFFDNAEIQAAYTGSTWTGESMGLIDVTKEIQASRDLIDAGFSNATDETAKLTGGDYSQNLRILMREKQLRESLGLDNIGTGPQVSANVQPAQAVQGTQAVNQ